MSLREITMPITRLTEGDGHYFFGYYDVPAFSGDGQYHLCHRVDFLDRLPTGDDRATLGRIRLADGAFLPITTTNAWNFQQGSMLQWSPTAPDDEIIFNRYDDGRYLGVIHQVHTGDERLLARPVATVDPRGRYALGINFNRVFDFRPGYGYANQPDPFVDCAQPADDGVFHIDLATGDATLLFSYQALGVLLPAMAGRKIVVNHITINPDGSRFLMLVRSFPEPGKQWQTALLTAAPDGSAPRVHVAGGMVSHYHWRDPRHLLAYANFGGGDALALLDVETDKVETLDPAFFTFDGHCSYSPDRRWLLYDSYPFADGLRHLYLYDLQARQPYQLGAFTDHPAATGDIRCDLHPRWDRTGARISFDATWEGARHVYLAEVGEGTDNP